MRNMSFAIAKKAFLSGQKDVTRRLGWKFLKPGDLVMGVNKVMGFKSGEVQIKFHPIQIVDTRWEPLKDIKLDDIIREGFSGMTVHEFIRWFCKTMNCTRYTHVNRIEFIHLGCRHFYNYECYDPAEEVVGRCWFNMQKRINCIISWTDCPNSEHW